MSLLPKGNEDASLDESVLNKCGITHILVAGELLEVAFPEKFEYKRLSLIDAADHDIKSTFLEATKFINSGKVTFVHCKAGVSRSATIVLAYLMMQLKMKFKEAYEFLETRSPYISPNPGFLDQLRNLEKEFEAE